MRKELRNTSLYKSFMQTFSALNQASRACWERRNKICPAKRKAKRLERYLILRCLEKERDTVSEKSCHNWQSDYIIIVKIPPNLLPCIGKVGYVVFEQVFLCAHTKWADVPFPVYSVYVEIKNLSLFFWHQWQEFVIVLMRPLNGQT